MEIAFFYGLTRLLPQKYIAEQNDNNNPLSRHMDALFFNKGIEKLHLYIIIF